MTPVPQAQEEAVKDTHAQTLAQCPVPVETQRTVQSCIPSPSPSHTALTLRMLRCAILRFLIRFLLLSVITIGCPRVLASTSGRLPGPTHPLALPPSRQYLLRAHHIPGSLLGSPIGPKQTWGWPRAASIPGGSRPRESAVSHHTRHTLLYRRPGASKILSDTSE